MLNKLISFLGKLFGGKKEEFVKREEWERWRDRLEKSLNTGQKTPGEKAYLWSKYLNEMMKENPKLVFSDVMSKIYDIDSTDLNLPIIAYHTTAAFKENISGFLFIGKTSEAIAVLEGFMEKIDNAPWANSERDSDKCSTLVIESGDISELENAES